MSEKNGSGKSEHGGKIVRLYAENVKRLKVVEVDAEGKDVITIGGRNAQGKSSLIESLVWAFGGAKHIDSVPIRNGAQKAKIICETDNLVVTRTFTSRGTQLLVQGRDGAQFRSPQKMLDELVGNGLSFDLHAFTRMDARKRAETLRSIVGLDFTDLDEKRAQAYDDRRDAGRELKSAQARLQAMPRPVELESSAEVSASDLLKELEAAQATNNAYAERRREVSREAREIEITREQVADAERLVIELEQKLVEAKKAVSEKLHSLQAQVGRCQKLKAEVDKLEDIDTQPILDKIQNADEHNRAVAQNRAFEEAKRQADELLAEYDGYDQAITKIDAEKKRLLSAANFPVDGLSFDSEGLVTMDGLPFDQCSQAQKIRVGAAMAMAMNPNLRVILITDASLLDDESKRLVNEMAREKGFQVWYEVVGNPADATLILEDGAAVTAEPSDLPESVA